MIASRRTERAAGVLARKACVAAGLVVLFAAGFASTPVAKAELARFNFVMSQAKVFPAVTWRVDNGGPFPFPILASGDTLREFGFPPEQQNLPDFAAAFGTHNPVITGQFSYDTDAPIRNQGATSTLYDGVQLDIQMTDPGTGSDVNLLHNNPLVSVVQGPNAHTVAITNGFRPISPGLSLNNPIPDTITVDLTRDTGLTSSAPNFPSLGQMPVRFTWPNRMDLSTFSVTNSDHSRTALSDQSLPRSIDSADFPDSSGAVQFRGALSVAVDPSDYSSPSDFQAASDWVNTHLAAADIDLVGNYALSVDGGVEPVLNLIAGAGARAIGRDDEFGRLLDGAESKLGHEKAFAFAGGTSIGTASGRGQAAARNGLNVGVFARAAGGPGDTGSRAFAFQTYINNGLDPVTVRVNTELDGEFRSANSSLPNGILDGQASIHVLDADMFSQTVSPSADQLEAFFLGRTPFDDDADARALTQGSLLERFPAGALRSSITRFLDASTFGGLDMIGSIDLSTGFFTIDPNETFTVLFDLAAYSRIMTNGSGQSGAGGVHLFDSLKEAPVLFTDLNGDPVTSLQAILIPEPGTSFAILTLGLMIAPRRKHRRRAA